MYILERINKVNFFFFFVSSAILQYGIEGMGGVLDSNRAPFKPWGISL